MESNDKLKEINIKKHTYYYFKEVIKIEDFDFDKVDGFIRVHDGTRHLGLFGSQKYDSIYNRIRYLIGVKSGIKYAFSHNYAKIKIDSLTFHNFIIFMIIYILNQVGIKIKITITLIYS